MSSFGEFVKARRAELGLTLRAFCLKWSIDPSNWSKMERGRLPPPQGERLAEYARFLQLAKGSDAWFELFDLAAAEAGRIPEDLKDSELLEKLPVLFRTLREAQRDGGRDSEELLEELERKVREA
jgi:transcriptional regulator with XRE-family HTH domain